MEAEPTSGAPYQPPDSRTDFKSRLNFTCILINIMITLVFFG